MKRKEFLHMTGMGLGALVMPRLPVGSRMIDPAALLQEGMDVATKKQLADIALNAARKGGATYADVRIGRYLNQFVITREKRVQNIANAESFGVGIRVIASGSWGFSATNDVSPDGIARAAARAVAVAKANSKIITEPVQLAPQQGYGEVSWKTPIIKNVFEVPLKEKIDLLMEVNGAAMSGGANFINSALLAINEQKYFA